MAPKQEAEARRILAALATAAERVDQLERELDAARKGRAQLVHAAAAAIPSVVDGEPLTKSRIARAAGVSPQAVDQMLDKPAPEGLDA